MEHIVLVGGGLANSYAAAQLRSSGFDGRVTMLSEEAHRPYDHVPLSKDYLSGGPGHHELYLRSDDFYRDHDIALLLHTQVTGLNPEDRVVELATVRPCRTPRCCWLPGPPRENLRCQALTYSTVCTTCARSTTPNNSGGLCTAPAGSRSSERGSSAVRSPPVLPCWVERSR